MKTGEKLRAVLNMYTNENLEEMGVLSIALLNNKMIIYGTKNNVQIPVKVLERFKEMKEID